MKKLIILIFMVILTLGLCNGIFAQTIEESETKEELSLFQQFPDLKFRDFFYSGGEKEYYRFPTNVLFFDPIDLGYFPHETWAEEDWSLLVRWNDTWTYNQLIMLEDPTENMVIHGTDIGKDYGFLSEFYLYATLFVVDNAPDGTGSCYVYYSDSLLKGFGTSTGVLIDPQKGIYAVDNRYESVYRLTNSTHDMTLLRELHPDDYPISEDDIASSSFGANDYYPYEAMDEHFAADWNAVKNGYRMEGSSIKTYRLEIIRKDNLTRIYINGYPVVSFDDGIRTSGANGFSPSMVSWSYGPILYEGGQTVTCAVGDFYIYGPAK